MLMYNASFCVYAHTLPQLGTEKKAAAASRLDYLAQPYERQYNYLLYIKEFLMNIMYENWQS